jgi:hypothetical protein
VLNTDASSRIEIKPMSCAFIKFYVKDHRGMVRLSIEFSPKSETELCTYIHRAQQKLSEDCYVWKFENTLKMNLRPQQGFDIEQLTKKQKLLGYDKELW